MDNAEVPIPTQEEASTEKDPPAQEKAIKAVNDGLSIYEADIPEASQTPSQKAEINEVKRKLEDLANGGDGTETVELKDESGKVIKTQKEGIPVYELVEHLNEKYKSLPKTSPQAKELRDIIRTLTQRKVTRDYLDLPYRWIPRYYQARVREEISRIKADGRTTGDDVKDEQLAKEAIARRREFFVPPPETTTPPPTTPPPITPTEEDPTFTVSFVDTSDDAKKIARESSGEFVREQLHVKNRWSPREWMRAIKFRLGEDYHKITNAQKVQEEQVRRGQYFCEQDSVTGAVREVNNGRELSKKQMQSTAQRFSLAGEGKAEFYSQEKHENLADTEISSQINNLITRYARGELTSEQFETERQSIVETLKNNPDVAPYIRESNFIASDILEVAQKVKLSHERGQIALENLDRMLNIQIGRAVMASTTEADYTRLEKTMNWLQGGKFRGLAANPLFIGVAFGVAGAGAKGILGMGARAATGFPIVGGGIATAFAGLRRWTDLKRDFELNERDDSYSRKANPDKAPRRAKLAEFRYNIAEGGGRVTAQGLLDRLTSLSNTENPTDTQIEEILTSVAEIDARINYGIENKIDLMAYTNRYGTESEKLKLVLQKDVALEKIKAIRKAQGRNDEEIKSEIDTQINTKTGEFWSKFSETKDKQNARFNRYRFGESLKAAGIAAVTATVGGLATQEILAIGGRALGIGVAPTIVEGALGINPDTGSRFGGLNLTDVANKAGSYEVNNPVTNQKLELVSQAFTDPSDVDRKIDFVTPDKKVVPGPAMWVTPDKGNFVMAGGKDYLPPAVKDMFGNYEFKVTSEHNLREYMQNLVNGDIKKTSDEVLSYGNFLLNTHDIKQSNFINPEGLPYDEWAAKVGRINPATGLVEEGKMSITHPSSEVQLHGFLRGDGSFDVNKDFYVNDQFPGNKNITPDQFNNVISNLKTEGWGVEDSATGYHITPPEAFELTAHLEEAPIIPIPFAPRHPLEPLSMPEVPYYPSYPESRFPPGARLVDILRRGRPSAEQLGRGYHQDGEVIVDQTEGRRALQEVRDALNNADGAFVVLGGAIGDAVISTAYLRGLQETFKSLNKDIPITLIVSEGHGDLFDAMAANNNIRIVKTPRGQGLQEAKNQIASSSSTKPILLDLEHYRQENPYIDNEQINSKSVTSINNLLAPAVELYNNSSDQERKFAKYTEDLFSLPRNSLDPNVVRPIIELPQNKDDIYNQLVNRFGIDPNKPQISVVVESQIAEKRYPIEYWIRSLALMSQQNPQLQFNIIYNPNPQAPGFSRDNIEDRLRADGILDSSHLVSGSLTEMAVLLERQALTMSNDTGLAHIATSIENGPNVLSLHIPYFPPNFWIANPKKQTALLPPEGETNIAAIPPELLAQKALEILGRPARPTVPTTSRTAPRPTPSPETYPSTTPAPTPRPTEPRPTPASTTETLEARTRISPERSSAVEGIGFSEDIGPRSTMEDAHSINENFRGSPDEAFFGIYDGHDGREVAVELSRTLNTSFAATLNSHPELSETEALKRVYVDTNNAILSSPSRNAGSTAVNAYIKGNKLFVANAGDARAVLSRGNQAVRLSHDHKVTDPEERARIERAGGRVDAQGYQMVGNEGLAVARAFGDATFRATVTAEPFVSETTLGPDDRFLIMACDGLWDVITDQEAADLIKNEQDPQRASEILKNEALRRRTGDNLSVLVVKLKPPEPPRVTETVESTTSAPVVRPPTPTPPPGPVAPAEEVTEELPVVAPVPPVEPAAATPTPPAASEVLPSEPSLTENLISELTNEDLQERWDAQWYIINSSLATEDDKDLARAKIRELGPEMDKRHLQASPEPHSAPYIPTPLNIDVENPANEALKKAVEEPTEEAVPLPTFLTEPPEDQAPPARPPVPPPPPPAPPAPEAPPSTQDMSLPELGAALREANLTASNYAESEGDRQQAAIRAQELTNEIDRKRAEQPIEPPPAPAEPAPEEELEATQQIPPQPQNRRRPNLGGLVNRVKQAASSIRPPRPTPQPGIDMRTRSPEGYVPPQQATLETPPVKTPAEMSDDELREELNQGIDRYLSGQTTEDEMKELERRGGELGDEFVRRQGQAATPVEAQPAEAPALSPEKLDRNRQGLDAYVQRYMQDNPGISEKDARDYVIDTLNQVKGQNGG